MTDFREPLQDVLGDRYRVERELGGGGMSRVFLAEETRLARKVVIKVLPPATSAGIESGRFEREIQVAASLHHPHIVQLLATGEGDGVVWYAMPFVEGESLSERLQRGPMPTLEAVRLLREVADALAYAHTRGIVHRDIKPANIMLSGRHALVTDFGVAKAVAAGQRVAEPAADLTALTSVGMALGTPAYMAPEQAVADPNVDQRADIYSLGVVAYEMLTGSSPYHATTPQEMLAAHVVQPAEPITSRRGDIPGDLAAIIMRCLAKAPADRFATAGELVDALELVGTPSGGSVPFDPKERARTLFRQWHPGRVVVLHVVATVAITAIAFGLTRIAGLPDWIWLAVLGAMLLGIPPLVIASRNERRRAHATMTGMHAAVRTGELTGRKALQGGVIAIGAVLLIAAGFVGAGLAGVGPGATLMSKGRLGTNAGLVLGEFTNSSPDSTLSSAILEALRVDLSQSRAVHLLQGQAITDALTRMSLPAGTRLTDSVAREVAQRANAKAVVTGEVHAIGTGFVLTASVIDATTGQSLAEVRETAASDQDLIAAVNRLSKSLREKIGESLRAIRSSEPLEQVTTASLPALRLYSAASRAFDANDFATAAADLRQAVATDSTFAMAWRKLAVTYGSLGNVGDQIAAAKAAYRFRDHLPPVERYLTEGTYLEKVVHDDDGAVAALRKALDVDPDNITALNNAGLILNELGRFDQAEVLLRHGIAVQPVFSSLQNLGASLVAQQKWTSVDSLPGLWLRVGGDSARAALLRAELAYVRRDVAGFDSTSRAALRMLPPGGVRRAALMIYAGEMSQDRGMLTTALGQYRSWARLSEAAGTHGAAVAAELTVAIFDLQERGKPEEAWPAVQQALRRYPLDSIAPSDRPYELLAEIAAMLGRADDVRTFRTGWEAATPVAERDSISVAEWNGLTAIATRQWPAAATAFQRIHSGSHCSPCGAYVWAYALDQGGLRDSAAAIYARTVAAPVTDGSGRAEDIGWYGLTLLHLGAYYQERGDKAKAIGYLTRFVALWNDADPDLQPRVKDALARIAELSGEPKQ
ncbi:MAG TPA: protein kinase [Gemmatimonadales bacterium]